VIFEAWIGPVPGGSNARREDDEPDAVALGDVPCGHAAELVDRDVERCRAVVAGPELDGCVEDEPRDVALLALHLADEQLPAPCARLPCDALEGIAGDVLAELLQVLAFARQGRGAASLGDAPCATTACGLQDREERLGEHLDAVRVREHQRDLVEALTTERRATYLERDAMNAPAPDALRAHVHLEAHLRGRREIESRGMDRHLEHARRHGP